MGTFVDPHGQRHRLAVPARRTGLARVGRVHPHHFSASFLRFAEQMREEHRPRGIRNTFCQFGISQHIAHNKRFYRDETEPLYELADLLLNEVLPPVAGSLMPSRYAFPFFLSFLPPFCRLAS